MNSTRGIIDHPISRTVAGLWQDVGNSVIDHPSSPFAPSNVHIYIQKAKQTYSWWSAVADQIRENDYRKALVRSKQQDLRYVYERDRELSRPLAPHRKQPQPSLESLINPFQRAQFREEAARSSSSSYAPLFAFLSPSGASTVPYIYI